MIEYSKLQEYAIKLKNNPSWCELAFKKVLDRTRLHYEEQVIIGFYIVDFVLPERMIIIEIDGAQHKKKRNYDNTRDCWLKGLGFKVVRIPSKDVVDCDWIIPILKDSEILGVTRFKAAMLDAINLYSKAKVRKDWIKSHPRKKKFKKDKAYLN